MFEIFAFFADNTGKSRDGMVAVAFFFSSAFSAVRSTIAYYGLATNSVEG